MPTSAQSAQCTTHRAAAGWTCTECEERLCQRCAARRRAGSGWVLICRKCGSLARPILVPRTVTSFTSRVPAAFAYPFSARGLVLMTLTGIVLGLLSSAGIYGWLLGTGALYSYLFLVIRSTSLGAEDLPEQGDLAHPFDLVLSALTALAVMALSFAPFIAYLALRQQASVPGLVETLSAGGIVGRLTDPFTYLSLLLGLAWVPMALMLAATQSPFLDVINPVVAVRCIGRMWKDYLLAAGLFWGLYLLWKLTGAALDGLPGTIPVPVLPRLLAWAAQMYLPLVYARILGLLLLVHGARLGYGTAADQAVPILGDLEPEEELVEAAVVADVVPIEFDAAPAPAALPPPPSAPSAPSAAARPAAAPLVAVAPVDVADLPEVSLHALGGGDSGLQIAPVADDPLGAFAPSPAPAAPAGLLGFGGDFGDGLPSLPTLPPPGALAVPPSPPVRTPAAAPAPVATAPGPLSAPSGTPPPGTVAPAAVAGPPVRVPAPAVPLGTSRPASRPVVDFQSDFEPLANTAAAAEDAKAPPEEPETIHVSSAEVLKSIAGPAAADAQAKPAAPGPRTAPARPATPPSAPVAPAAAPVPDDAALLASATAGRWAEVLAGYRARKGDVKCLHAVHLVECAQEALRRQDYSVAAHALRRAGLDHPKSPSAPHALLQAGEILAERLRQPIEAVRMFKLVVERYPTAAPATKAREALAARGPGK